MLGCSEGSRLTGREKIEAALSPDGTPEIGVVIPYEGIYIRDNWSALTKRPWWWADDPGIRRQLLLREEIQRAIGQDWYALPTSLPTDARKHIRIEARPDGMYRIDDRDGSERKLQPPVVSGTNQSNVSISVHPERLPESPDEIDALIPIPTADERAWIADGRDDLAKALIAGPARDLYPVRSAHSPLWDCYGIWGFEGLMILVATRPDLVARACERYLAGQIQGVRQMAVLGARGIWVEECLTDQISPEAFAALNVPYNQRLIHEIRRLGMHSIYYYCGDPAGKWDLLLSVGADALSLEEGKKGFEIDIDDVVEQVQGRCAVFGNLDAIAVLQNGSEETLRREIARQIAAGRRNNSRFIMSLGSPVPPGTPPARVRAYCDMAREIGAA